MDSRSWQPAFFLFALPFYFIPDQDLLCSFSTTRFHSFTLSSELHCSFSLQAIVFFFQDRETKLHSPPFPLLLSSLLNRIECVAPPLRAKVSRPSGGGGPLVPPPSLPFYSAKGRQTKSSSFIRYLSLDCLRFSRLVHVFFPGLDRHFHFLAGFQSKTSITCKSHCL